MERLSFTLRFYGDPILLRRAGDVQVFDETLREQAVAMVETMRRENGVGLAAPQVGLERRLLIALDMDTPEDEAAEPVAMVNPVILSRSRETWVFEEGCLSIPGIRGDRHAPGEDHRVSAVGPTGGNTINGTPPSPLNDARSFPYNTTAKMLMRSTWAGWITIGSARRSSSPPTMP